MENIAKSIIEYGILTVIAAIFLYVYISDVNEKREERKEDRKLQRENNDAILELTKVSTSVVERNTDAIRDYATELKTHSNLANKSLNRIEDKMDMIQKRIDDVVTKEMLTDVKEEIKVVIENNCNTDLK